MASSAASPSSTTSAEEHEAVLGALGSLSMQHDAKKRQEREWEGLSMSELFFRARTLHARISESGEGDRRTCQDLLLRVLKAVQQSGVFSSNEQVDDVNTIDLKFLLCPFLLGDLCMSNNASRDERKSNVTAALAYLEKFLSMCDQLRLLTKEDRQIWKRPPGKTRQTPAEARAEKIGRYKAHQHVKQQLAFLLKKQEMQRKRHNIEEDQMEDSDDDREVTLMALQGAVHEALNHRKSGLEELTILMHMESMSPADRRQQAERKIEPKPIQVTRIRAPGAKMEKFTIGGGVRGQTDINHTVNQLVHVRDTVFRDANPCTMTVEEGLEEDVRTGKIPLEALQQAQGQAPAPAHHQQQEEPQSGEDEDDHEASDMATYKARNWDNWKDDNEKGVGNRNYRN